MNRRPVAHSMRVVCVLVGVAAFASTSAAQTRSKLTVQRVFSREFADRGVRQMRWLDGGTAFSTVEPSATGRGFDIVRHETATDARSVLVSSAQMTPSGSRTPLA